MPKLISSPTTGKAIPAHEFTEADFGAPNGQDAAPLASRSPAVPGGAIRRAERSSNLELIAPATIRTVRGNDRDTFRGITRRSRKPVRDIKPRWLMTRSSVMTWEIQYARVRLRRTRTPCSCPDSMGPRSQAHADGHQPPRHTKPPERFARFLTTVRGARACRGSTAAASGGAGTGIRACGPPDRRCSARPGSGCAAPGRPATTRRRAQGRCRPRRWTG